MKKRLTELVRTFRNEIYLYRSILRDPRCPRLARWLLGGAVAYALSPIDLIPDFIPVVGHLDDLLLLPLLVWLAFRVIPKELAQEHRAKLNGGNFSHVDLNCTQNSQALAEETSE